MLVIPKAVYQLFAARNTANPNGDEEDMEMGPQDRERHHPNSSHHHHLFDLKKSIHLPGRQLHRRPSNLDLDEPPRNSGPAPDTNCDSAEDADSDSTRTYRNLPIFSGIMIPFSIMLSIPSLTGHWYVRTGENHALLEARPNPILLDVAMGLSMGCGVLASACLVVRFAERMIKRMTFMCILFLTLHDLINITSVTIFGVVHRFDDGFTYGQSFWMTVCSTIVSTATNITLLYDYHGTKNFRRSGSGLTHKQRSLVIIIIVLLCYVSLGSLVQTRMLEISFIDALYFSVLSIETIGFGDITPTSTGTRIFTCFYIAGGILNLALAVALSREALLEAAAVGFQARMKAARMRARARRIRTRWRAAIHWRLRSKGLPTWVDDRDDEGQRQAPISRRHRWYSWFWRVWARLRGASLQAWEDPTWKYVYGRRHKRLNLEALPPQQLETAALEAGAPLSALIPKGLKLRNRGDDEEGKDSVSHPNHDTHRPPSLTHVRMGGMVSVLGRFAVAFTNGTHVEQQSTSSQTTDGNAETAYEEIFRPSGHGIPMTRTLTMTTAIEDEEEPPESLEAEEKAAFYARLSVACSLFLLFWMAGSAIFMKTEGWTFGNSAYFCFTSFTTVGYGDFAPKTPAGRSIFVAWALLGVGTMTILISILAEAYSNSYRNMIKTEEMETPLLFASDENRRFFDSRTVLNTGTVQDSLSPTTAVSESPSVTFASPATPRFGRSLRPSMAPIPELGTNTADEITLAHRRVKERLEALPHQVLRHVDNMRSIMGMSGSIDVNSDALAEGRSVPKWEDEILDRRKMEELLVELHGSLREIVDAARDALITEDI